MILESAQILCTVLWIRHVSAPYKPTHKGHPCVIWANHSLSNWCWLKELACALNDEYKYRFNHSTNHKSYDVISTLPIPMISDIGLTTIPQVVPIEFQVSDAVSAYRQYYIYCKAHIAHWTKRPVPWWFLEAQS